MLKIDKNLPREEIYVDQVATLEGSKKKSTSSMFNLELNSGAFYTTFWQFPTYTLPVVSYMI